MILTENNVCQILIDGGVDKHSAGVLAQRVAKAEYVREVQRERLKQLVEREESLRGQFEYDLRQLNLERETIREECDHELFQGVCQFCGWQSPSRQIVETAKRA